MRKPPSTNGSNGRDGKGRFATGNAGGPGNPHARRVAKYRSLLVESVSDDDFRKIVRTLIDQAASGDLAAVRLLLDRLLGRSCGELEPEQLELRDRHVAIGEQRLKFEEEKHEDHLWEN